MDNAISRNNWLCELKTAFREMKPKVSGNVVRSVYGCRFEFLIWPFSLEMLFSLDSIPSEMSAFVLVDFLSLNYPTWSSTQVG